MTRVLLPSLALLLCVALAIAQPKERPKLTTEKVLTAEHVYKKTPEGELTLHCFMPADWKATDNPQRSEPRNLSQQPLLQTA